MSDQASGTNVEQPSFQKQSHTANRAWLIARLWVAAVILLLHVRLFLGEVMGDASIWVHEPFRTSAPPTFRKHVNEIQGDIWRQYVPFEQTLYRAGQAGRLAEWNPHIFLGHNFAGNAQAGHFHPLQLPFYVVDSFTWHGWSVVARLTLSAWFTLAWCRRVGMSPLAGSCSATSWVLSAFCTR